MRLLNQNVKAVIFDVGGPLVQVSHSIVPTPGAFEAVMRFSTARVALGVCTTYDMAALKLRLDSVGLPLGTFAGFCTGESPYKKPDPIALRYVMHQLNVEKENTVYIGDNLIDLQTAADADVTFLALTSLRMNRDEWMRLGVIPFFIINKMSELAEIFEGEK